MAGKSWVSIGGLSTSQICSSANLMLPRVGFSARSLARLTSEDPLFRDDLSGACVDDSGEVGALCVVSVDAKNSKAWLKFVCAHQSFEEELEAKIKDVLGTLRSLGVKEVRASDRPGYHFRAGLEKSQRVERRVLERLGFRAVRSVADLELDLCLFREFRPKKYVKGEFVFGPAEDRGEILDFVERNFGVYWRLETEASLREGGVVQAKLGDKIVGFADYCGFEEYWFGPTGVLEELRGRGVGSELLFSALTRMRERGLCRATIPWTEHLTFYGQTDAVVAVKNLDIFAAKL